MPASEVYTALDRTQHRYWAFSQAEGESVRRVRYQVLRMPVSYDFEMHSYRASCLFSATGLVTARNGRYEELYLFVLLFDCFERICSG